MQAFAQRGAHLPRDSLVRLAEVLAPLAVPQDHALAAGFLQHDHAHLAGERALLLVMAVLREQLDRRALQGLFHRGERAERRSHGHLRGRAIEELAQLAGELRGLAGRLVHLPVAADELTPGHRAP